MRSADRGRRPGHRGNPAHRDHRGSRRRARLPLLAVSLAVTAAAAATVGGAGTLGWWNDTARAQGATLGSGSLDLTVDGAQGNPTAYAWTAMALASMAPGESRAAQLTLGNAGTTPFTVGVAVSGTGTLLPHLAVTVVDGATAANSGSAYPRTGSCTGGGAAATVTPTGTPTTALAATATVPAAGSRTLCVLVALPGTTPGTAQGAGAAVTLDLTAAQVQP